MKRSAARLVVLFLVIFLVPSFFSSSFAQSTKPAVKNEKGVIKGTKPAPALPAAVRQPRMKDTQKIKYPDPAVTRLYLNTDCKIFGYIQNKGRLVGTDSALGRHMKVRVWYTLDGKTEAWTLGMWGTTSPLFSYNKEFDNFLKGRPARIETGLILPESATVWAEVDPDNRIQESPAGEMNNRFQTRLTPTCAAPRRDAIQPDPSNIPLPPSGSPSVGPAMKPSAATPSWGRALPANVHRIKKPEAVPDAGRLGKQTMQIDPDIQQVGPSPSGRAIGKMVTKGGGGPEALQFISPVRGANIPTGGNIDVAYEYLQPVSGAVAVVWNIIGFDGDDRLVETEPAPEGPCFDCITPEGGRFGVALSRLPNSFLIHDHYRIRVQCHSQTGTVAEGTSEPFTIGRIIGTGGGGIRVDERQDGLRVHSPAAGQCLEPGSQAEVEIDFTEHPPGDPGPNVAVWIHRPDSGTGPIRIYSGVLHRFDTEPGETAASGMVAVTIPSEARLGDHWVISVHTAETPARSGSSPFFTIRECTVSAGEEGHGELPAERNGIPGDIGKGGAYIDPLPVSNGLQISSPGESYVSTVPVNIEVNYTYDIPEPPANTRVYFSLSPRGNSDNSFQEWHADLGGRLNFTVYDSVQAGFYRIHGKIIDEENQVLATGSSAVFRLERSGGGAQMEVSPNQYAAWPGALEITSPTAADWYIPGDRIVVRYNIGSCSAALEDMQITMERHNSGGYDHYLLHRGPLNPSGEMSFPIPPGSLEDEEGFATTWQIKINDCANPEYTGPGCMYALPECLAISDSFRMSLVKPE
jgi:hypothetical protein